MKLPGNPFSFLHNTPSDPASSQKEEMLRATLANTYAAPEAPVELCGRIADMAALRDQQMVMSPAHRRRPLKIMLACSVFTLLIGAYFIGPHVYAALTLRRIQKAMLNTRTAHITSWNCGINEIRSVKKSEIWNEGDRWRIEQDEGRWLETRGVNGMPMKRGGGYPIENNSLDLMRAFRPLGLYRLNGFSLLDSVDSISRRWILTRVEGLGTNREFGRALNLYSWQDMESPKDRLVFSVNPKTDLPVLGRIQHQDEYDVWKTVAEIEYQFNEPMPPRAFDYPPRPEVKLQEAHLSRAEWWTKLNIPIVQSNVEGENIAIRDFRVNASGDVFMLYTVNKGMGWYSDEAQTLTDDKGSVYLRAVLSFPFRPTIWDAKRHVQGFTFENGKELKAAWWVPLRTQNGKAWNPRRFTLIVLTRDLRYPYDQKDTSKKGFVKFSLPVYQTDADIVPSYMPYMAMKPGNLWPECAIPEADAMERAIYYQETRHEWPQALQWLNVEQQKQEDWERIAQRPLRTDVFLRQYKVLSALGRHEEARAALRKTKTRSFDTRSWDKEIKKAMEKEGMK